MLNPSRHKPWLTSIVLAWIALAGVTHGQTHRSDYGYLGPVATVEAYDVINGQEVPAWHRVFDPDGKLLEATQYHHGNALEHEEWVYSDSGKPVTRTSSYPSDGWYQVAAFDDSGEPWQSKAFTDAGELLGGTVADDRRTPAFRGYTRYDETWRPVYRLTGTWDDQGNVTEIAEYGPGDALMARVEQTYDADARLVEQRYLDGNGQLIAVIPFEYDADGNPTRGLSLEYVELVLDAGWDPYQHPYAATYVFDGRGDLVQVTNIDPSSGEEMNTTSFTYDDQGNPLRRIETSFALTYDEAGDITGRTPTPDDDSSLETRYEYDSQGNLRTETVIGKFGGVELTRNDRNGNRTQYIAFDPRYGHVIREEVDYEYDALGNWTKRTSRRVQIDAAYPEGLAVADVFQEALRLTDGPLEQLHEPDVTVQRLTYHAE